MGIYWPIIHSQVDVLREIYIGVFDQGDQTVMQILLQKILSCCCLLGLNGQILLVMHLEVIYKIDVTIKAMELLSKVAQVNLSASLEFLVRLRKQSNFNVLFDFFKIRENTCVSENQVDKLLWQRCDRNHLIIFNFE